MNIQHSSRSDSWGTPVDILEKCRAVLGSIDFDPASSALFNHQVKATKFLTKKDDALKTLWDCGDKNIFLNPPGGKLGNKSMTGLFWRRLLEHRHLFNHAIFLAFSLEALQTTQKYAELSCGCFPCCIPKQRIRFLRENGLEGPAPSHSNVIVYVPGKVDVTKGFEEVFSEEGTVLIPKFPVPGPSETQS